MASWPILSFPFLEVTLMECLECKPQLHDTKLELLKNSEGKIIDHNLPERSSITICRCCVFRDQAEHHKHALCPEIYNHTVFAPLGILDTSDFYDLKLFAYFP